jgi:hypothetical protein
MDMNLKQARVVDPVLTGVAVGFKHASFVGETLFPSVPVPARGGKIIEFLPEDFELYNTGRAPGSNTKRVAFGHTSRDYNLVQYALEATVPVELLQDAAAVPGIDLASTSTRRVVNVIALRHEKECADLATDVDQYDAAHKKTDLAGTTLWSDPTGSDPIGNIEAAKEAIRATIGRYPNVLVLGAPSFKALRVHADIIDRLKYTGRDSATEVMLAGLFGVDKVVIGGAVYKNASGQFADLWGKAAVLGYSEVAGLADMGSPSFGYSYRLDGYPIVEEPYLDRNTKTWCYPVTDEVKPMLTCPSAGFLITPTVA